MVKLSSRIVFLDSSPHVDRFTSVVSDFEMGASLGEKYLKFMGHNRIAFAEEILQNEYTFTPELLEAYFEKKKKENSMPTAFIALDEVTAINLLQVLKMLNYRVPEDCSLLCCNDSGLTAAIEPGITSLSVRVKEMAQIAVGILEQVMSGERQIPQRVMVPMELVIRDSVRNLNNG